ncbi:MAG: flagellar biosynthetic protein FliO [Myxococcota bacterium]|nr:flagellar biosynthetic protein FliO [Myxococcota bacterium]
MDGYRLLAATAAPALNGAPAAPADLAPDGSPFFDLVVMLLAFLLAVGLAWFGARLLVRRLYGPSAWGGGRIRIVERIPLEPRRTLYLIHAGEKILLVGSTDNDIRVLAEFQASDLPAPAVLARRSFLDALRAATARRKAPS